MQVVTYTIIKRRWLRKPFRWIGVADNNEVVARSSSGYHNRKDAEDTIRLIQNSPSTAIKYKEDPLPKVKVPKGSVVVLLALLLLSSLLAKGQTYTLKSADKAEYLKYTTYCDLKITVDIVQYGKAAIKDPMVPGLDFEMTKMMPGDMVGYVVRTGANSVPGMTSGNAILKDTVWYKAWTPGTVATSRTYKSTEYPVERIIKVQVPIRKKSINDFYQNWKTGKLAASVAYMDSIRNH